MLRGLLRSKLRAKLLSHLFSNPGKRFFARQLEMILGESQGNISRELGRLETLGIVSCQREGRQKLFSANRDCPIFQELHSIVIKTSGLAEVLRRALRPLARDIQIAFIYGSAATGELRPESDVDMLVVGAVDEIALHSALARAESRLNRPVNYMFLGPKEFERRIGEKDGFLARILRRPKIIIRGKVNEI